MPPHRVVVRWLCLLAFVPGLLLPVAGDLAHAQQAPVVPVVTVQDPITPAGAGVVADAIRAASDEGAPAVVLRVEARSGTFPATNSILVAMLESAVPVLT